ncbi:MAG: hypothetical protein ACRDMX_09275, partial [Solirubrobacteraceae bacterium]
ACTYYARVGSFTHKDAAGLVHFRFTGRIGGHTLRPGRYQVQALPRNAAGAGTPVTGTFAIRRGRAGSTRTVPKRSRTSKP